MLQRWDVVKTTLNRFKEPQKHKRIHRTGLNPISNHQRNLITMVKKDCRLATTQLALQWWNFSKGKHASPSAKGTTKTKTHVSVLTKNVH